MFKNKESFNDFVWSRVIDVEETALQENEDYQAASKKRDEIFDEARRLFPQEVLSLLVRYCDIHSQAMGIAEYHAYKQGLKDGARVQMLLSEMEVR